MGINEKLRILATYGYVIQEQLSSSTAKVTLMDRTDQWIRYGSTPERAIIELYKDVGYVVFSWCQKHT